MKAYAKINLALVVGPTRDDGMHEVVTVLQRVDLHDDVSIERADTLEVVGFAGDTIVANSLTAFADAAGVAPHWRATIVKRIPVAAGLGGGSSDAAAALTLANELLDRPLSPDELHEVAAGVGADVPFFLRSGTQLATGTGTELKPVDLPLDYHVVVVVPDSVDKASTAAVYADFDGRAGPDGFASRAERLRAALTDIASAGDLARLPSNDLASSPLTGALRDLGALRADVSGAGPAVYGVFGEADAAERAAAALRHVGRSLVTRPV